MSHMAHGRRFNDAPEADTQGDLQSRQAAPRSAALRVEAPCNLFGRSDEKYGSSTQVYRSPHQAAPQTTTPNIESLPRPFVHTWRSVGLTKILPRILLGKTMA